MDIIDSCEAVTQMHEDYPEAKEILCEDKANGPAVMQTLYGKVPGLIAVGVEGDKPARMKAAAPWIEAGNVLLPHPDDCPWVTNFIDLVCSYPKGSSNDDGDSMIMALNRLMDQQTGSLADIESRMKGTGTKSSPMAAF